MNEREVLRKIEDLYKKVIQSLPDGIYEHADGELYVHQTYCDPRKPNSAEIKEIYKL